MSAGIPFLLAYCSLIYELILAQYLSLYFGGTLLNFSLTISLFLFSMGVGAIRAGRFSGSRVYSELYRVEIFLSLLGALSPFWISLAGGFALKGAGNIPVAAYFGVSLIPVLAVGYFSGFEVPFLMQAVRKEHHKNRVLAWDYIGSFVAAIVYPLWMVPNVGLVRTSLATSFVNLIVALWIGWKFSVGCKKNRLADGAGLCLLMLALLYGTHIENFLRAWMLQ